MNILSIVSGKGGVGKTTVSANLSRGLRQQGLRVLSIDLDPQNGLRLHFNVSARSLGGLSRATLEGENWRNCVVQGGLGDSVLPYGMVNEDDRMDFEQVLRNNPNLLREQLERMELHKDTIVVIDTPPGASVYLSQALNAANAALTVLLPDAASYATLPKISSLIHKHCLIRPDFYSSKYLINQVDRIKQLSGDITDLLQAQFGQDSVWVIHQDQAIPEAFASSRVLSEYDAYCRGTHDFNQCVLKTQQLFDLSDLKETV